MNLISTSPRRILSATLALSCFLYFLFFCRRFFSLFIHLVCYPTFSLSFLSLAVTFISPKLNRVLFAVINELHRGHTSTIAMLRPQIPNGRKSEINPLSPFKQPVDDGLSGPSCTVICVLHVCFGESNQCVRLSVIVNITT